ncbi:MAG: hypothetical protein HYV35_11170 [Lentisphaerae bacterium]|nr:hypothetical protein [Lentisphaerota bacterium]
MRGKILVGAVVALLVVVLSAQSVKAAKDPGAAGLLSMALPGVGEWYNNDWKGTFPWGECVIGHLCCLVQLSSVLDAVAAKTDSAMRLDFWSAP